MRGSSFASTYFPKFDPPHVAGRRAGFMLPTCLPVHSVALLASERITFEQRRVEGVRVMTRLPRPTYKCSYMFATNGSLKLGNMSGHGATPYPKNIWNVDFHELGLERR